MLGALAALERAQAPLPLPGPPVTGRAGQADGGPLCQPNPKRRVAFVGPPAVPFLRAPPALSAPPPSFTSCSPSYFPDPARRVTKPDLAPFPGLNTSTPAPVSESLSNKSGFVSRLPSFRAQIIQWRGDLTTGRARRRRCRRRGRTSTLCLAMASTGKSSHQTSADTSGTTHWCAPAPTRYGVF